MCLEALNLLVFPSLLLLSNLGPALFLLSTALGIALLALLLELEAGFDAGEVVLLFFGSVDGALLLGCLGLGEPVDVLEEALLNFVFDHLAVEVFLSLVLGGADLLDLSDKVLLLAGDTVEFLLVGGAVHGKNTLFFLHAVDLLADALKHLVDLWQVLALSLLHGAQLLNIFLELLALFEGGSGGLDLFDLGDERALIGIAKGGGGEATIELLDALFELVEGVVDLVAGLGQLVALPVDVVDLVFDFLTLGKHIALLIVPLLQAVEVAAQLLGDAALAGLATA